jgi:hypothetical protein
VLWNKNKTIHQLSAFLGVYDSSCQDLLELLLPKHARLHTRVFFQNNSIPKFLKCTCRKAIHLIFNSSAKSVFVTRLGTYGSRASSKNSDRAHISQPSPHRQPNVAITRFNPKTETLEAHPRSNALRTARSRDRSSPGQVQPIELAWFIVSFAEQEIETTI